MRSISRSSSLSGNVPGATISIVLFAMSHSIHTSRISSSVAIVLRRFGSTFWDLPTWERMSCIRSRINLSGTDKCSRWANSRKPKLRLISRIALGRTSFCSRSTISGVNTLLTSTPCWPRLATICLTKILHCSLIMVSGNSTSTFSANFFRQALILFPISFSSASPL